jgi:hypothetical protein
VKDTDYDKIIELTPVGGGYLPVNQNAHDLLDNCHSGEVLSFREVTERDVNFHRAYFSFIGYIYDWLPKAFKETIPKDRFYQFLKHLKGEYKIIFEFKDGTKFIEYKSIAFGRMSQKTFEEYVRSQLPFIYGEVIQVLYKDKATSDRVIQSIEDEYERFLMKL